MRSTHRFPIVVLTLAMLEAKAQEPVQLFVN